MGQVLDSIFHPGLNRAVQNCICCTSVCTTPFAIRVDIQAQVCSLFGPLGCSCSYLKLPKPCTPMPTPWLPHFCLIPGRRHRQTSAPFLHATCCFPATSLTLATVSITVCTRTEPAPTRIWPFILKVSLLAFPDLVKFRVVLTRAVFLS